MGDLDTGKKTKIFLKPLAHLPVKDLQSTLTYYEEKLGFSDPWMFGKIDGGIRRDDLGLLFAEDEKFVNDLNNASHRLPIVWFVSDIDGIYSEFQNKGIEIRDKLRSHPYGLREFSFIDVNGYYIRVAEAEDEPFDKPQQKSHQWKR
jgi:hypothetical protein